MEGCYEVWVALGDPDSVHSGRGLRKVSLAPVPMCEYTTYTIIIITIRIRDRTVRTSQKKGWVKTQTPYKLWINLIRNCVTLRTTEKNRLSSEEPIPPKAQGLSSKGT